MKTNIEKLEIYVHMTGPGTVRLRNVRLVQYPDAAGLSQPQVNVPASVGADKSEELVVSVSLDAGNIHYSAVGMDYRDVDTFQQMLIAKRQANPNIKVVLRAEKHVPYKEVVRVLDAVRQAQIPNVSFATASISDLSPAPEAKRFVMDPVSFALGVAMSVGAAALIFLSRIITRLWRRQRANKEMRRIASLDT